MPDIRDIPGLSGAISEARVSLLMLIAVLVAACYITYILCFVYLGRIPADGVLLSGVIGVLLYCGGVHVGKKLTE